MWAAVWETELVIEMGKTCGTRFGRMRTLSASATKQNLLSHHNKFEEDFLLVSPECKVETGSLTHCLWTCYTIQKFLGGEISQELYAGKTGGQLNSK